MERGAGDPLTHALKELIMKKPLLLILVLALVLLSGCGASGSELGSADLSQDLWSISDVNAPAEEKLAFVLETETRKNSAQAEDGTLLVKYRYQVPVLRVCTADGTELETAASPAQEKAMAVAKAFNTNFTDWGDSGEFQKDIQFAQEDYAVRPEAFQSGAYYESELTYTAYQTEHLISIRADYYAYTGGAHGNTSLLAWNFDLDSGQFVSAADLSDDPTAFSGAVTDALLTQMEQKAADAGMATNEYFLADGTETVAQWTSYAVSFDENGMTVGFSPYELACYAAGPQEFSLDYKSLAPNLSDYGKQLLGLTAETNS